MSVGGGYFVSSDLANDLRLAIPNMGTGHLRNIFEWCMAGEGGGRVELRKEVVNVNEDDSVNIK